MTVRRKVSNAQNAEDVRVWRTFRDSESRAGVVKHHDMALLADPDALWDIP